MGSLGLPAWLLGSLGKNERSKEKVASAFRDPGTQRSTASTLFTLEAMSQEAKLYKL